MYGLVKTHEVNNALLPIVAYINSPTYYLTKYIADLLNYISEYIYEYNILDSIEFENKITRSKLPPNYQSISLDVASLFTNIPLNIVTDIITDKWTDLKNKTDITKK